jgi:L,D-transpeptidase catalytic domain
MGLSDIKALMCAVARLRNMSCKALNASIFVGTGLLACALCAASPRLAAQTAPATGSADAAPPTHRFALSAGEYLWMPELAPAGPVVIVISLPEQLAYVYRNGVRIGVSTVSTGKPGYETPTGVFTILQKQREHYSNLYNNAPMPFMQRLTWGGVALHAGKVPGYPASHGCVRLPYAFSEKLFGATSHGMTVVIANETSHAPEVSAPGWFAPVDPATGAQREPVIAADMSGDEWMPDRAPDGPLTIVLSTHDRKVVVLRNGVEIGRANVVISGEPLRGTQAYVLLEGTGDGPSTVLPDRPALRWLSIAVPDSSLTGTPPKGDLRQALAIGQIRVGDVFAHQVYDALRPGATVVVTDEPIHRTAPSEEITVLRADETPVAPILPTPAETPLPDD